MQKVLVVEYSLTLGSLIKQTIESELKYEVDWFTTLDKMHNNFNPENYFVAILNTILPDAPNGEIVDIIVDYGIPSIVFTSNIAEEIKEDIWEKRIVDYIHKEDYGSIEYLLDLVKNIKKNPSIKILVVDDSPLKLNIIGDLLNIHQYDIYTAQSGEEALEILSENPDIKLATIDYNMDGMDGVTLVKNIRQNFSKEKLALIGLSSSDEKRMSARFIKAGANDFLTIPFSNEEFYCRISQNIQYLSYIEIIQNLANKDGLTGLYNRRYFYEYAAAMFDLAKDKKSRLNVAIMDIDHFKNVNDNFGHDAGDMIIEEVASTMMSFVKYPNIVARIGGEEFAFILFSENLDMVFEKIHKNIENTLYDYNNKPIRVTLSCGVCVGAADTLRKMLKTADDNLYIAKQTGRNKVVSTIL
jgi:diguanylate cyclase (GGDEF)-like protein